MNKCFYDMKFMDNLTDAILLIDENGKIIDANISAMQLFDYNKDELTNLFLTSLIDINIADLIENEKSFTAINHKKDGTKFYSEVKSIKLEESSNIIIYIFMDSFMLFELIKHNSIVTKTIDIFDDSFIVVTNDCNIYLWSKSAEKKFGYTKDEVFGKSIKILIPQDRIHEFEYNLQKVKQNITIEGFVTKRLDKYNNEIDVSITMSPLYDCKGDFNGVIGTYKDITEIIKLEEQLKESEKCLRFALESAQIGVWDWNIKTGYLEDPYLFKDFLGYDDVGEHDVDEFFELIHPEDINHIKASLEKHLEGHPYEVEYRMKCKNGSYKWIQSKGKVHKWSEDGQPLRMIGINEDITEKKKIQEELNNNYEQLKKMKEVAEIANEAKTRFLANMSHEIRTPMNGLFAVSQLLKTTELDAEQLKYVNLINDSINNLKNIIDDILDLSKIESGKMVLNEESFDLRNTVNNIYCNLLITGNAKDLEISYYLDPSIDFKVVSDEVKLKQILNNLTSNAVKFTNQGFISFRTKLIEKNSDFARIEFKVKDTGIGIKDEFKDVLFQEFSQGDISKNKKYKGTGLGLSITKQLANLFNGEINYKSKYNEGSTFIFTCDFKIDKNNENEAKDLKSSFNENKLENKIYTILSVEDNFINQEVIGSILHRKGYKYLPAYNGEEALNILKDNKIDLILMDIQLPEFNGFQITEMIRKEFDPDCKLPIIAITAYAMHEDREKCLNAGMIDYIAKPFDVEELYKVIEKNLVNSKDTVQ